MAAAHRIPAVICCGITLIVVIAAVVGGVCGTGGCSSSSIEKTNTPTSAPYVDPSTIPDDPLASNAVATPPKPPFTAEVEERLDTIIAEATVVDTEALLQVTLPPTPSPTPSPTRKGFEVVFKKKSVNVLTAEMTFALSAGEAASPVMRQVGYAGSMLIAIHLITNDSNRP